MIHALRQTWEHQVALKQEIGTVYQDFNLVIARQLPTDSSMEQLIQLLKRSPEIVEPLLQMSHILKGSK